MFHRSSTRRAASAVVSMLCFLLVHGEPRATFCLDSMTRSAGLQNLGNTCYLNAQLQCAFHIPRVRDLILDDTPKPLPQSSPPSASAAQEEDCQPEDDKSGSDGEGNEENSAVQSKESPPPPQEDSLALQALRRVFREMETSSLPVAPRILCQMLGIPVLEQQDSQEFWKLLLPTLNLPALTDLYQGSFEDYIRANDGSNRERNREEPFLDLSLDVSKGSILDGLKENFGEPELLSVKEGNGWRPAPDADKVDALKGSLLRVQGLPSILQLHLKRFNYDWQTDQMSKLNQQCSFPKDLDLATICADIQESEKPAAMYALQAVVVHVGEYGAGHYYAYVRPDIRNDEWYRYNDHVIAQVSFTDVVADAYGGRRNRKTAPDDKQTKTKGPGPLQRLQRIFAKRQRYGFGGPTSNAYVLQYVRCSDIPNLYGSSKN